MNRIHIYIIAWVALAGAGCSRVDDVRLLDVAGIVDDNPQAAMENLQRINYDSLSEPNRHYYDLLSIKAKDKLYIEHGSDSLILDVIDYSESHRTPYRAEALYYGGRVYSDLGDYPTSLDYFQKALDATDATDTTDSTNLHLRGNIISQMAQLFTKLYMQSCAIDYTLEAIRIDSIEDNVYNLAYDYQMLSHMYRRKEKYDSAKIAADRAVFYGKSLPDRNYVTMLTERATIYYFNDDIVKALSLVRGLPERANPGDRNFIVGHALQIYYDAGIYDTAYIYAKELTEAAQSDVRITGYKYILMPELMRFIPEDSVMSYMREYKSCIDDFADRLEDESAVIQNASYNYNIHKNRSLKAERSKYILHMTIALTLFLLLVALTIIGLMRYKGLKQSLSYQVALNKISSLQMQLEKVGPVVEPEKKSDNVRRNIRDKYLNDVDRVNDNNNAMLCQSEVMKVLHQKIKAGQMMKQNDELWEQIEALVLEMSPHFIETIMTLSSEKITQSDLYILYLLKCGFTPTQLSVLLGRTKGTISSRRIFLSLKMFGSNVGNKRFDAIIRGI